jgi:hypothetical protein
MGQYGQFAIDDIIACIIRDEARKANIPDWIPMGIAGAESGWDPAPPPGDNGRSWGLFQLYIDGGQGSDYVNNPQALNDPRLNTQIAMPYIAAGYVWAVNHGYTGTDLIRQVAVHSGHPGAIDPHDPRVDRIVDITMRLIMMPDGSWATWPPFNASVCAGVPPPPPPLDSWSEGPAPTSRAEADAAIEGHLTRIGQLIYQF